MLILQFRRNFRTKTSFIILVYRKGKRMPICKLGKFFYDFRLNKFLLHINLFLLNFLYAQYKLNIALICYRVVNAMSSSLIL